MHDISKLDILAALHAHLKENRDRDVRGVAAKLRESRAWLSEEDAIASAEPIVDEAYANLVHDVVMDRKKE